MYQLVPDHNAVIRRPEFRTEWEFDAGAQINGGLAIVEDTLIVDTLAGDLIALDARDGSLLWHAHANNALMSSPVIKSGVVFVGTGTNQRMSGVAASSAYFPSSNDDPTWGRPEGDAEIAFDMTTGKMIWRRATRGEDMPSPAILNGTLVFANGDLHAYGLDWSSGLIRWRKPTGGVSTMASATVSAKTVLLSVCGKRFQACATMDVNPVVGSQYWRANYGSSDSSPAVSNDLKEVFVSGVESVSPFRVHVGRAVVAALSQKTGSVIWEYDSENAGPYSEVGSSERAVAGTYNAGTLYQAIPTEDRLIAFDGRSGSIKWAVKTAGPVKMSPVVDFGHVYFGDSAGVFYNVDAANGALLTTRLFKQPFSTSPPIIVGSTIIIADSSKVLAFPIH